MGRAIVAGEAAAVHAETDGETLQRHVMNDHVVGALHEGRVDREEGLVAAGGHAAGEKRGVFLGNADVVVVGGQFLLEDLQLGAAGHGGGDRDHLVVGFRHVRHGAAEDIGAGRGGGDVGRAVLDLIGAEAVELAGVVERGLIAAAFLGDDVEDDRFVERFQVLEGFDQQRQVVTVDRAEVAEAELFEEDVREQQVLGAGLDLVGEVAGGLAGDLFDEFRGGITNAGVGRVGLERVEIAGDSPDVLVDRPLVVVEHDDELLGGLRDVVESFQSRAAGEGGIAGDGDHVGVVVREVACGGHAEGGGEGGAGVTGTVAVVLGLGAQKEAVEAFVSPDRMDLRGAAGEHLVDVALVGDVEDEVVLRCGEHAVEGNGQLDDAEVRPQVAAGTRKRSDQRVADLFGKLEQIGLRQSLDVSGRADRGKQRSKGGWLRRGGCRHRRRVRPGCRRSGREQSHRCREDRPLRRGRRFRRCFWR